MQDTCLWHEVEGAAATADAACRLADSLEGEFAGMRDYWRLLLSLYETRRVNSLDPEAYIDAERVRDTSASVLRVPLPRSLCDTVQADIAGRQRPKPVAMTSGADWQTQRKAERMTRFLAGQMAQRQGKYLDAWDLMQDAFLDASIYGICWVYVGGSADGQVVVERCQPGEVLYDPCSSADGDPLDLIRVSYWDETRLLAAYVDGPLADGEITEDEAAQMRRGIIAAKERRTTRARASGPRVTRQVRVVEAWRVALSDDQPGRHVVAVEGATLLDEEWVREDHPFLALRWSPDRIGLGGTGLIEESRTIAAELDDAMACLQRQHRLNSGRRVYYSDGSIAEEHLQSNEDETHIPVQPGVPLPTVEQVPALNPSTLQLVDLLKQFGYEFPGVSMMSATSRKEPGVEAGVAIRTLIDMATKRFAVKARGYESAFIRLAELMVEATRDMVRAGIKVQSRSPGEQYYEDLEWRDVDLERDQYVIQLDVVSSLADRAAGRMATAEESLRSGLIDAAAYQRIMPPGGTLDLTNEQSPVAAQYRYFEWLIDRYLDAEDDDPEAEDVYEGPEGFILDFEGAVRQWVGAYFTSRLAGAPEFNLELLRRFIGELDVLIQQKAAEAAALQAQAAGGPPGMPPGPMPPMAPPPGAPPV